MGRLLPERERLDTYTFQTSCSGSTRRAAWRGSLGVETALKLCPHLVRGEEARGKPRIRTF